VLERDTKGYWRSADGPSLAAVLASLGAIGSYVFLVVYEGWARGSAAMLGSLGGYGIVRLARWRFPDTYRLITVAMAVLIFLALVLWIGAAVI
jgi:hypothetical protein